MCGRYIVISNITEIETRFGVNALGPYHPNYNISPGSLAPIITDKEPDKLQFFHFGMTPFWAKKKLYFFNARAEGDNNKENDPNYSGALGIIAKPSFKKAIRSQRCLVIADAFIEGTTAKKLDEPFLVHLSKVRRPFAFAGIWDEWLDKNTGEIYQSFAIITTTPNSLLRMLPHHRSPVILPKDKERDWLNLNLPLADIIVLLRPYEGGDMNAYPISTTIKNPRNNSLMLLQPSGPSVATQKELKLEQELLLLSMGISRIKK